jgi:uncharacterized Ntn-hydrolase superfamily protein
MILNYLKLKKPNNMKFINLTFFIILFLTSTGYGQDTFSIIALDTITGEIGGAGASCIDESAIQGGVLIINDIIPGRGGIHTQAYWLSANQQNAHNRMVEGMSPQEIIDWLVANDVQNNPGRRQYGITDFDEDGNPRSAAFTGVLCDDYKNHITGRNYAIQGNILLGQHILDSMESRFLNTEGTLAEKLMASLQGANVPGADTRCLNEGVSSLSAFVRVAKTDALAGNYWCDLLVPSTPYGVEPIDSLQVLFDEWLLWTYIEDEPFVQPNRAKVFPNPASKQITFEIKTSSEIDKLNIQIVSISGEIIEEFEYMDGPMILDTSVYPAGIYLYRVYHNDRILDAGKFSVRE